MRKLQKKLLIVLMAVLALSCIGMAEDGRKIVKKVAPVYPQNARQLGISGSVKLEVTVAADGNVKSAKVVAGHPFLAGAAVQAVTRWKYEAGAEDVRAVVVNFGD